MKYYTMKQSKFKFIYQSQCLRKRSYYTLYVERGRIWSFDGQLNLFNDEAPVEPFDRSSCPLRAPYLNCLVWLHCHMNSNINTYILVKKGSKNKIVLRMKDTDFLLRYTVNPNIEHAIHCVIVYYLLASVICDK